MTDVEWDRVVELLATNWPHQLQPDNSLEKFRRDLDAFPVDQVLVAIETFYRDGREFPPNSGQVLGRVADLVFGSGIAFGGALGRISAPFVSVGIPLALIAWGTWLLRRAGKLDLKPRDR
jgi:hypothetical protein